MYFQKQLNAGLLNFGLLFIATSAAAFDWPQWRGPNRDGLVSDASIPRTWPKELKQEWKTTVGVGHSSPVVADGRIYVFARQEQQEVLLCLDSITGKEIWRSGQLVAYEMHNAARAHGKGPKSTPVLYDKMVYTLGISGVLSCHDTRTGNLKWRREFSQDYPKTSPLFGTAMSPLVSNGQLIAHVGGHDKGALIAFDAATGATKWSNEMDGPAYSSPIVVNMAGTRQVVTFMQSELVGVEAATGKLLWKVPAKSQYEENSATPIAYKDLLIVSREEQGVEAFRLVKQGADIVPVQVWSNKETQLYMNTPVLQGTLIVGLSARNKGQFFSIDADTGKTLWLGPGRVAENAAILNLGGKVLLMLTNDAKLVVLPATAKGFAPVAEYTVAESPTWAHPTVIGNRILIKDETTLRSLTF
ncbi:MAG: PQQ-like beta-propeller repeat protein [Pyrinomonadaceae bacterium]|nr:PQQ-like beta-propeller repeat protein [Pyrinomonadaceae bacterium]